MDTERVTEAVVDRFENGLVVLLAGNGKEVVCSESILPASTAEGDVVRIDAVIQGRETQARNRGVRRLIDEL